MRNLLGGLALFLFLPFAALAQDLPRPLSDTVSDYDGILPAETAERVAGLLAKARAETGVHVVLVAMDRREAHAGQGRSIEDYAKALFNLWGVGDRSRDDGVMILVAAGDREMRVQLGAGYGSEWDGVAQGVIDAAFLPKLRAGDAAGAVEAGTAAVIDQIARPFASGAAAIPPPAAGSGGKSGGLGGILLIPVILLAGIALAARRMIGDLWVRLRTCPQCGSKGSLRRSRSTVTPATAASDGWGKAVTTCDHCSYRTEDSYTISRSRDRTRRGGGGGGFGGGRSSGGGATGRW